MWLLIGLAIVSTSVADAVFAVQEAEARAVVSANSYNFIWTAGALLLALAAWAGPPRPTTTPRRSSGCAPIALALFAQALAIGIQIYAIFHEVGKSERIVTIVVLVVASVQIILTRPRTEAEDERLACPRRPPAPVEERTDYGDADRGGRLEQRLESASLTSAGVVRAARELEDDPSDAIRPRPLAHQADRCRYATACAVAQAVTLPQAAARSSGDRRPRDGPTSVRSSGRGEGEHRMAVPLAAEEELGVGARGQQARVPVPPGLPQPWARSRRPPRPLAFSCRTTSTNCSSVIRYARASAGGFCAAAA